MKKVSIIIPVYNRAHLIGETLDSILAQTYTNWECIVVDDGSTDNTLELLEDYAQKDSRFKYYKRPYNRPKGGNAARNYGFQKSTGDYIQWFDSDDIMVSEFLEVKIRVLENESVDFVISRSINFGTVGEEEIELYDKNKIAEISARNFIFLNIFFMTPDFMSHRNLVKNHLFNEMLRSGQETNFFITLLALREPKGAYIDEKLTYRRLNENSIQQKLKKNKEKAVLGKFRSMYATYRKVNGKLDKSTSRYMRGKLFTMAYHLKLQSLSFNSFFWLSLHTFFINPLKSLSFSLAIIIVSIGGSSFKLLEYARS
ncbi:MAG TPA: hypothetical protein DEA82_16235 [Flavobacteriaceae bacterium]|nr:hypothetical protein [Flavobacteriaceae bacterium]HBR55641.1 hypothetical protein [Flavobacteriaceae bacterium]